MTIQATETFLVGTKIYDVMETPLCQLGDSWCTTPGESDSRHGGSRFGMISSANWRGYRGTWKLEDGKLFLVQFEATGKNHEELGMQEVFGTNCLFAFWFCGEITDRDVCESKRYVRVWEFLHGRLTRHYKRDTHSPEEIARQKENLRAFIDSL